MEQLESQTLRDRIGGKALKTDQLLKWRASPEAPTVPQDLVTRAEGGSGDGP